MNNNSASNSFWQLAIITLLLLYCTGFMAYTGFKSSLQDRIPVLVGVIILVMNCANYNGLVFGNAVKGMILGFILSQFSSSILYNQSLYQDFAGIVAYILPICIYFLLYKWQISENYIYFFLVAFTVIFAFFEIFQQFSYPQYWFAGRMEQEWSGQFEMRMGIWRFYLFGINYCMLAFALSLDKFYTISGKRFLYFVFTILSLVAIFFFVARKNIYSVLTVIILGFLMTVRKAKMSSMLMIGIVVIVIYPILSSNMIELNEKTSMEMSEQSEDFIRFVAARYFMYDFNSSPLYYIFGAGCPGVDSSLEQHILYLIRNMGIYQDDCGVVGYFSRFGLLGIFIQIYIIYLIIKNWRAIDLGLILFGVMELEMCFFDFWGNNMRHMAAFAIYIYLIERSTERNKLNKRRETIICLNDAKYR